MPTRDQRRPERKPRIARLLVWVIALSLSPSGADAQASPGALWQARASDDAPAIDPGRYPDWNEHSLTRPIAMAATGTGLALVSGMVALISARGALAVNRAMDGKAAVYGPRLDINDDGHIDRADRTIFQRTFYVSLGVGLLGVGIGMMGVAWLRDVLGERERDEGGASRGQRWPTARALQLGPEIGPREASLTIRWTR